MEAVFKIKASEFNEVLFAKIKSLIKGSHSEITIAVKEEADDTTLMEKEFWDRLKKSRVEIEAGKGVTFTMKELEDFIRK